MRNQSAPDPHGRRRGLFNLDVVNEYPRQFWILVMATFIDRLGGSMLFPFFTLYLTRRFNIGMTEVGLIFGLFSISSVIGSVTGGALTDRLGRKGMLLFGLVMSAVSTLLMGTVDRLNLFLIVALVVGVLAEVGGPAQQALVADILPEEKRAQGYGILRVVFNLAVTFGPILGGLLATRSYLFLFIADAVTSIITAVIVLFTLKETWKPQESGQPQPSMAQTFAGYGNVLRDNAFLWYMIATALSALVYIQMNTTLGVYLRDNHGVTEQAFGYILSLNAGMVVLLQFSTTRWVSKYRPLIVMAAGTVLYAVGFAMYGFVSAYVLFLVAMAVITVGEMMVSPVGQAIVACLAPEEMRGRYMAVFGFSWVIPIAIGPLLAGIVLDNLNPNWLWYGAGVIGVLSAVAYYLLEWRVSRSRYAAIDERLNILEQVEQGQISAETANQMLLKVGEGTWARLTPKAPEVERRHLRIRVSDPGTGTMKVDLRLPMGLVNTVMDVGGHLSPALVDYNREYLNDLISLSACQPGPQHLETGGDRLEVVIE